ncbi:MAG: formimidoylglutamate deiminase [Myxococcales bacterium]|nr:formimidoylglutamate deiminase [Myxococcales bacterium]
MDARPARLYTAACGLLGDRWVARPQVTVDDDGVIVATADGDEPPRTRAGVTVIDLGDAALLPGLVNAHSHAFQRMIRGRTHARGDGDPSSFWSWREAMYRAAATLDPEGVYQVTRACFDEMLASGITCVGEFHYLHHQPDGAPYDDPCELSLQVLRAARDVGIRLALLEVYYARAGAGQPPLPEQRRFVDGGVDAYLRRVEALLKLSDQTLSIGLAPHSVRAVDRAALTELAAFARARDLPVHAHVSEQPRENAECLAEHGLTPTALLAATGCLDRPRRFTAVHAIHVTADDRALLADQSVCACPTTEADLGDGIVDARALFERGVNLSLGTDSNAIVDLIQEARLLEMHDRLRAQARLQLAGPNGQVAPTLATIATRGGAVALGRPELGALTVGAPFDAITIDRHHRSLAGVPGEALLDALLLAGTAAPVEQVYVGGARRR